MKNSTIINNYNKIKTDPTYLKTLLNENASKIQKSLDKKDNVILDFYGHEVNEQVNKLINIGLSNIYSGVTFLLKDNVNYKGSYFK